VETTNSKTTWTNHYDLPIRNTEPQSGLISFSEVHNYVAPFAGYCKVHKFGAEKPISSAKPAHFDFFCNKVYCLESVCDPASWMRFIGLNPMNPMEDCSDPEKLYTFQSPGAALEHSNKHGQDKTYLLIASNFLIG
jgi:hypothetical protein